jgi:hypothetical protein
MEDFVGRPQEAQGAQHTKQQTGNLLRKVGGRMFSGAVKQLRRILLMGDSELLQCGYASREETRNVMVGQEI